MPPLQALLQFFAQFQSARQRAASSHAELVERLQESGALTSPVVKAAFAEVDRRTYCVGAEGAECYADRPFRAEPSPGCIVHLSAPSISTRALEALELRPGLSFLNVGSGTGWFSTIVASLIGRHAVHHAVELRPRLVELATRLAHERGLEGVSFHCASVHDIDPAASMRFDRIYVGRRDQQTRRPHLPHLHLRTSTSAPLPPPRPPPPPGMRPADKAPILGLLREGGIAVGPFENEEDGEQHLMKATRRADAADGSKMRFVFEGLMRVSFTPLVGQASSELRPAPGQRLALQGPRWGAAPPQAFPPSFIAEELTQWHAAMRAHDSLPAKLPWDVWSLHILPCLAHDAFEKQDSHGHAPT